MPLKLKSVFGPELPEPTVIVPLFVIPLVTVTASSMGILSWEPLEIVTPLKVMPVLLMAWEYEAPYWSAFPQ